jgi:hypothetical protein
MKEFSDYREAYNHAVTYARQLGREVGIERAVWYGKTVFVVKSVPAAKFRFGHELRMEIVAPSDPLTGG